MPRPPEQGEAVAHRRAVRHAPPRTPWVKPPAAVLAGPVGVATPRPPVRGGPLRGCRCPGPCLARHGLPQAGALVGTEPMEDVEVVSARPLTGAAGDGRRVKGVQNRFQCVGCAHACCFGVGLVSTLPRTRLSLISL